MISDLDRPVEPINLEPSDSGEFDTNHFHVCAHRDLNDFVPS